MNIGFIGLGKLGLPVSVAIAHKGHTVFGYDPIVKSKTGFKQIELGYQFKQDNFCISGLYTPQPFNELLETANINFSSLEDVVRNTELIFVAVQTPHDSGFEGNTPLPPERQDFNYFYLINAIKDLNKEVEKLNKEIVVNIISTVLPSTIRREIIPILDKRIKLSYSPLFIAMGTVIPDYLHPEFVLLGNDSPYAAKRVIEFYETIHSAPIFEMSIESAELTKVAYNTMISTKIAYANFLMEICHKVKGCNVDDVTNALKYATNRLISPKYLTAGMGDGGGCHPRDNIAMSWLARKYNVSFDYCNAMMIAREAQTEFLVDLMMQYPQKVYCILGTAFKPETKITTGSPAILAKNLLESKLDKLGWKAIVVTYDPKIDTKSFEETIGSHAGVFLIGCKHREFSTYKFPQGAIVIDPHRYIPDQTGVKIIRVGEHK